MKRRPSIPGATSSERAPESTRPRVAEAPPPLSQNRDALERLRLRKPREGVVTSGGRAERPHAFSADNRADRVGRLLIFVLVALLMLTLAAVVWTRMG